MTRRYWTVPELREFARLYPTTTAADLAARFGRTRSALKNLAVKLGLHKTPAFMREHCRLRPGHPACGWNRGLRYKPGGRASETQFKKGHRGHRTRPVGTERIERDAVMVKIAEPNVWKEKKRIVWEQHFGPIPKGALVRLKDGDRLNCALENLQLVTRAENIRLNWKPKGTGKAAAKRRRWTEPLRMAA